MKIPITQATIDAFNRGGAAIIAALGDDDSYEQRRNVALMLSHSLLMADGSIPESLALKNNEEFCAQLKALIHSSYAPGD